MKLLDVVSKYLAYKRGLGIRFNTGARDLMALCRTMGVSARLETINRKSCKDSSSEAVRHQFPKPETLHSVGA